MNAHIISGIYIESIQYICMTKSIQVTDEVHKKLFKLKGFLYEGNISLLLERLCLRAGYGPRFFEKWNELIKHRPELIDEEKVIE